MMYVNKHLDYIVRDDLSVIEDEYETLWIEIKTGSKAKNILCCCVYRHPNTDPKKFVDYMDNVFSKLSKANKSVFLMSGFNVNLLSYETHSDTNDFINSMVSHYLLPYILHPTRVTLSICTKNLEIKLFQRQGKTELIILTTASILTKTT